VKMFDAGKSKMIGLPYGEKNCYDKLSRFHLIPEGNGRTDRQTDRFTILLSRVSMLRRDKNHDFRPISRFISEYMQDRAIVTMEGE